MISHSQYTNCSPYHFWIARALETWCMRLAASKKMPMIFTKEKEQLKRIFDSLLYISK